MNERIKELAKQAGGHKCLCVDAMSISLLGENSIEKFAELIVKECAAQIVSQGTDWVDFAPSQTGVRPEYWDMAQQIKKHFGVEQ